MTISSTTIQTSGSTGNGVTTQFSFSFSIADYGSTEAEDQIQVIKETIASGAETILTRTTDYTVSVNGDQGSSPGGAITMLTAPSSAYKIWIRLNPDFTQQTDLGNQSPFNAQTIEDQCDQHSRQIITLLDRIRRAPRVGVQAGSTFDGEITGDVTPGYIPQVNSGGTGFELVANNGSSNLVTATGSTTARTLAQRFAEALRPEDFGAVGDGATDDTAAFTALLAVMGAGDAIQLKAGATYLVDGLLLPNTTTGFERNGIFCDGGSATIKKRSSSNTTYLVAFSYWDANSDVPNNSWWFQNVIFDGNSLCDNVFINRSYISYFAFCIFYGGSLTQMLFTRYAKDGTTLSSTYLSDCHWLHCFFKGGSDACFKTTGSPTDGKMEGCSINGNSTADYCIDLSSWSGWNIMGNQTYSATDYDVYLRDLGQGGVFSANHVGGKMLRLGAVNSTYGPKKIGPANVFWNGVTADFTADATTEIISIEGNFFRRTSDSLTKAYIEHNYDSAAKIIISRNNDFETNDPHRLGSGKTLGAYIVQGGASTDATDHRLRYDIPNLFGFRNRLLNGDFRLNQRGAATNADDTYCLDRWYALTQSNDIAASQLSNAENGSPTALRLTQSNASAQRMGCAQIIETLNCRDLRGNVATLSGRVRLSTTATVRYAVVEWTGTADAVTSDVVNDWTSSTYTAGNFFNSTTLNVLATGSVACTAATWRSFDALTATVGSSANNLIVIIWTDATVAQNVTLDLGRMQLERGYSPSDYELRPMGIEMDLCKRFYQKSFNIATAPAQSVSGNTEFHFIATIAGANTNRSGAVPFPVEMRTTPSITLYNPAASNAQIRDANASADTTNSSATAISLKGFRLTCTANASTAIGNVLSVQWSADAEL